MRRARTLIVSLAVATCGLPAFAAVTREAEPNELPRRAWLNRFQESRQGPEVTEPFSGTYKIDRSGAVDVNHIAGDVRVTTGGSEVRITATKRVRHRDPEEAKRLLAALRIDVTEVGGRIEIRTVYPRTSNRNFNGSVDYTINVPETVAVAVKTISGDVSVTGVRGEVRAETVSGDVEVVSTPNLAVAKTVSGDVRARDISASTLTLATVSGTVVATALKVRTLEATSVSGDVRLGELQVERLNAKTFSGSITFDGALAPGGRYEFTAHSGDVRLTLPGDTRGFELDASTFSGSVRSDFPVAIRSVPASGRRGEARAIRGTYGDAASIVALRSFSGSVVITRK